MSSDKDLTVRANAKQYIDDLYNQLIVRKDQSSELRDITDVLLQSYKKMDDVKNPEALVNRLVNYIRSQALKAKIHFPSDQENLVIELETIGQKAGLNGVYMADYSDKSQFYSLLEKIPKR
ncbi:bacteriocin immunity protein [Furfurilactobacillus milii]|uniref:bacteriocin immunity protein n=1 Tax=Furfurilactobacillus milii TaxID=2888272 RepID=UPI001F215D4F|nr:bacteriocin immunity protein [Furfurilactobacillus milii]MCF6418459.1 bacteriocin immunity protein [Furfurilactobacillus milii]